VNGKGSAFLHTQVRSRDLLEVSAPRGSFTLQPGEGPVVLLSAGIGATPVLAMLHALAASRSAREVWWLYGCQRQAEIA
jgi:ferredoxin-NADP reductase